MPNRFAIPTVLRNLLFLHAALIVGVGLKGDVGKEAVEHLDAKIWAFRPLTSPIWARNLLASSSSVSPAEPPEDSF